MFYIPLYAKSENTLLGSMIKVKDLVLYSKKLGYKAVTLTDNNMFGVYEFYTECIKNDIKPIVGLEVKIDDNNFILYAKNYKGYQNLIKISTIISEKQIEYIDLNNYSDDLICIVPYTSRSIYKELNKIYSNIFIGYKNKQELEHLKGNNLVYMDEILYLTKEDGNYFRYLKGIKENKIISEIDIEETHFLRSVEEINNNYKETLNNYEYIYNNCNLVIEKQNDLLPIYQVGDNYTTESYLKEMCRVGLKKRFGDSISKVYIDRIKKELEVINEMGFSNYFLIVMDYVRFAKENNILVGPGRGSAAGSLVAYALFITDIDPIKYNLLFERFLNKMRITMPDIDIDFEYNRRDEVVKYCQKKYGLKKVAGIITFGTLASKQVIRDTGRVMNLSLSLVDSITKMIDSKKTLNDNLKQNKRLEDIVSKNKEVKKLYEIASKLEGLKRHTSVHAAGIVISNKNIDEVVPIIKHDDIYLTCYTMNYLEEIGLLKMDFLALKNLNTISSIIEYLKNDNINVDFNSIPLNDKDTFEIFKNGNTTGIFQFESEGMKNFLRKLKPDSLEDLFSAIALYRPGPISNIDSFINRKQGREKINYIDSRLENILKPTYGILIYQEQIMQISNVMAGYTLGEADILRRAMSKKKEDIILKEKDKFISGSIKNGYKEEDAKYVYDLILKFASYGFNRSHSVAYTMIAYKMAYLKSHYNKYFMKSLLDNVIGTINTKNYIYEAKANDINVLNPDINLSSNTFNVEENGIRFPFSNIKNLGYNTIKEIMDEREKGKYKDIFDFVKRIYSSKVNKKALTSLIDAGCFDSFNINHKTLTQNIDLIVNYAELSRDLGEDTLKPDIINYDEYSNKELLEKSLDVFGFYLSNHPVSEYRIKNKNLIALNDIKKHFDKKISTIIMVDSIKKIDTKKGDKMAFINGSDELNSLEFILFPDVYKKYTDIKKDDILKIYGRVEKRFDQYQMIVNEIKVVN